MGQHVIKNLRDRIRIIYQEAQAADADLARGLAECEDQNVRDLDRIAMAEAQIASDRKHRRELRRLHS
jgi:hypothetical protein